MARERERLLGGLAARSLEAECGVPGWRVARLTVDLFRPAAMALVAPGEPRAVVVSANDAFEALFAVG